MTEEEALEIMETKSICEIINNIRLGFFGVVGLLFYFHYRNFFILFFLAPGGGLQVLEEDEQINPISVFQLPNDDEILKQHSQLIVRDLLRRYKYLQVSLEESMVKVCTV